MTRGIGVDIVDIRRIEKLVDNYSNHFISKVFTPSEISYCTRMAIPALHYAGRWAVKEAFYKALPVSCQKIASWKSIEILSTERGKPEVILCSEVLEAFLEQENIVQVMTSISHEKNYCVAIVMLQG